MVWIWNGDPVKMLRGTELEIKYKKFNKTPNLQKVITETSNIPLKKLNDQEREIYNTILEALDFNNYKPKSDESKSGRYKQSKSNLNKRNLEGEGVKIIIPSNIIDIYIRPEISLGLKLSGYSDILTEAGNLIDELYKRGEIQNKQQYRNALNKFSK